MAMRPDSADCQQYRTVKIFLKSEPVGLSITHIWVDFSCINQDRSNSQGLAAFLLRLDNIPTAIFLAHVVLVVPRLATICEEGEQSAKHQQEAGLEVYTDLEELNARGWCLAEAAIALQGGSRLFVSFVAGQVEKAHFEEVRGGLAETEPLSMSSLLQHTICPGEHSSMADADHYQHLRSYTPAVSRAVQEFKKEQPETSMNLLVNVAVKNWELARDPARFVGQLHEVLADGLLEILPNLFFSYFGFLRHLHVFRPKDLLQMRAATLTVNTSGNGKDWGGRPVSQLGKRVSSCLPNFTAEADREVVTRLLVNVGVFVRTGFHKVKPRSEKQARCLLLQGIFVGISVGGRTLALGHSNLLPPDVTSILAGAGGWKNYAVHCNPLGSHGLKEILNHISTHKKRRVKLNIGNAGLGVQGAMELRAWMMNPSSGSRCLVMIALSRNAVGDDGAKAIGEALASPGCGLVELHLRMNAIGNEGVGAIGAGLRTNTSLRKLNLRANKFTDEGMQVFADSLAENISLRVLDLGLNSGVGEEGQRAVQKAWGGRAQRGWKSFLNFRGPALMPH